MGDNSSTKNVYMYGHDAGIKGTLTDGAKKATFTMDTLKASDKVTIAGKEYTIGSATTEVTALIDKANADATADTANKTVDVNGKTYTITYNAAGNTIADADGTAITLDNLKKAVTGGSKVTYGNTSLTAMTDADTDGVDDDDSSIITKDVAETKIKAELLTANNIGTVDQAATVEDANTANGKTSYTINKGYATVADTLSFNLHVGADADMTNKITVDIDTMNSANLGIKGINVKDASGTEATYAIDAIADAVAKVSSQRSALGAVQNRLEHTIDNLDNISENTSSAESRIRDTDMAKEMVNYSKNNILAQAGQSMLAQANQSNQGVLSLLQ